MSATPLFGRDDLLARATASLDGGSHGVVFVGEGGVGKSRLAAEVVRLGAERGFHAVSTVGTTAATAIPLGALSHLLPSPGSASGNVLVDARAALARAAGDRPLLLAIDDAHLLDDHSAALVLQLAMSMPSFVVATVRTGESVPDPVRALWKEGHAERVEVGGLDDAAIAHLAGEVLGAPVDPTFGRVLAGRARGNALVARELCLAGRDAGTVVATNGTWSLAGELPISSRLAELIGARIDDLDPAERDAIDLLAHGEPIGLQLVEPLVAPGVLGRLERRGALVLRDDGRRRELWLSHPIYAEVVRATAGPIQASSLVRRLASATESTGMRRRSDVLRVAAWRLAAGERDAALLRRAAAETHRAGDMVGTARFAAGAWDAQPDPGTGILLATALAFSGRYQEADAVFTAATALATDERDRIRTLLIHATILFGGLGQAETALAMLRDAEEATPDPTLQLFLRGQQAHIEALRGRTAEALDLAEPVLAEPPGPVAVAAAMAAASAHTLRGRFQASIDVAERALPIALAQLSAGNVSVPPEMFRWQIVGGRVAMGELGAIDDPELPDRPLMRGVVLNRPVALLGALHRAVAALQRGRPRTAEAAIDAVGPQGSDLLAGPVASLLAIAAALTGRSREAAECLGRAEAVTARGGLFDPYLDVARLWAGVAAGRPGGARVAAATAVEGHLAAGRESIALLLAHDLARVGGAADGRRALDRLTAVDGDLASARRAHIEGLASGDLDALEGVAETFANLGVELLAAEAATDAARAARRAGEPRRATRWLRRAEELADRCEGARTPALVMAAEELTPLSRRELEIADLVAGGLSSEEVASRLFLSVRTVDNHLQHVYQKLGIGSRAELREALSRRP